VQIKGGRMKRESDEVNIIDVYMYENACIIA
jgi:hypothetical protein